MKRLVIAGASGMVGRCALRYALHNPKVELRAAEPRFAPSPSPLTNHVFR
jgi:hypothetical protein